MPRPVWTRHDQLRADRDPGEVLQRRAQAERVVQPARRAQRWRASGTRRCRRSNGEEVPDEHIAKGYEISKGRYIVVNPDELEPFMPAATKTVDLEEFVDLDEIDPVYFDAAYLRGARRQPEALRAAGAGDGGEWQGRHRAFRDAQQAVHRRHPGRGRPAGDVDTGVRRRGARPGRRSTNCRASTGSRSAPRRSPWPSRWSTSLGADFEPEKYRDEYREQVMELIQMKAPAKSSPCPRCRPRSPRSSTSWRHWRRAWRRPRTPAAASQPSGAPTERVKAVPVAKSSAGANQGVGEGGRHQPAKKPAAKSA